MLEAARKIYQGREMIRVSNIAPINNTSAARQKRIELAKKGAKLSIEGTRELNEIKRLTR